MAISITVVLVIQNSQWGWIAITDEQVVKSYCTVHL